MTVQLQIIIYSAVTLFAVFFSLKRFIKPGYQKLAWATFLGSGWIYLAIIFYTVGSQYHLVNSTLKLISSLAIFAVVSFLIYRLEKKYRKEINDRIKHE